MLLEKSENLLELSVKHLVIRLVSWISLGQAMIGVWKNQMLLFVAKLSISVSNKSLPSLSPMSNCPSRFLPIILRNLYNKNKNIVSLRLSFQGNSMI